MSLFLRTAGLLALLGALASCGDFPNVHLDSVTSPTPLESFEDTHIQLSASRLVYWRAGVTPAQMAEVLASSAHIDALEEEAYLIRTDPDLHKVDVLKELGERIRHLQVIIDETQAKIDEEKAGANRPARIRRYEAEKARYISQRDDLQSQFDVELTPDKVPLWNKITRLPEISTQISNLITRIQTYAQGTIRTETKITIHLRFDGSLESGYVYGLETPAGQSLSFSLEESSPNTLSPIQDSGKVYQSTGGVLEFAALRNPLLLVPQEPQESYEFRLARTRYASGKTLSRAIFSGELAVKSADGTTLNKGVIKFLDKPL